MTSPVLGGVGRGGGGGGGGDCIRAIGCAEEKRGEETRASLLIRQQPASSANCTVHKYSS